MFFQSNFNLRMWSSGQFFNLPISIWASLAGGPPGGAAASSSSRPAAPVAEGADGMDAEPAEPVRRVKIYTTPQEVLCCMMPPGCRMVLNFNDHRFMTTWLGPEPKEMPLDLRGQHFSKRFTNKPWRLALAECHERIWTKWSYVKKALPLKGGMTPQEPGKVPEEVLTGLEPFLKKTSHPASPTARGWPNDSI